MKKQRGFTLIEILIVVVILAILATLILPRMLAQPEGALIAEASQQLGALARAQDTYMQLRDDFTAGLALADADVTTWNALGLQQPPVGGRFSYNCDAASCTATRLNAAGGTISIWYTNNPKIYTCTPPYTVAADNTRGCIRV